jgi:hypothetical protein
MSKISREPTDEERSFYCKPVKNECTALAIAPETLKDKDNKTTAKGKIAEMVNLLEAGGAAFQGRVPSMYKYKEKGIVIKVKKNIEEAKEVNGVDGVKDKIKDLNEETATVTAKNLSEEKVIDYLDYAIEDEEMGPII